MKDEVDEYFELNDDHYQEETDIWLDDFLVEFKNEAFYCNGGKVTHEKMIRKIDFYMNVTDNLKDYKEEDKEPLTVPIFNMHVDIYELDNMFRKFEPNI